MRKGTVCLDYRIKILRSEDELDTCYLFKVDHFQWTCLRRPVAYGRMGYLPEKGFLLRMVCEEDDPKRNLTRPRDMVCKDSAMEAFFALPGQLPESWDQFAPRNDGLYLNFEVNANGAMYAKYGWGRQGRSHITPEEYRQTGVRAGVEPGRWWMELLVPQSLIRRLCGIRSFQTGNIVYCNFYKISEDPAIEHYASFHPIHSETPNFHLPEQFAKAIITSDEREI